MYRVVFSCLLCLALCQASHAQTEAEFRQQIIDQLSELHNGPNGIDALDAEVKSLGSQIKNLAQTAGNEVTLVQKWNHAAAAESVLKQKMAAKRALIASAEDTAQAIYGKTLKNILEPFTPGWIDWAFTILLIPATGDHDGRPITSAEVGAIGAETFFGALPMHVSLPTLAVGSGTLAANIVAAGAAVNLANYPAEHAAILEKWNEAFKGANYDTLTLRSRHNLQQKAAELDEAKRKLTEDLPGYDGKAKHVAEIEYFQGMVNEMQAYWDHVRGGDANGDGQISQPDLDILNANWGPIDFSQAADLDGDGTISNHELYRHQWDSADFNYDGVVDSADFYELSVNWGT